jgi:hypothetical protein
MKGIWAGSVANGLFGLLRGDSMNRNMLNIPFVPSEVHGKRPN